MEQKIFGDSGRADPEAHENGYPVIDISYVELPEQVTYRINSGSILGAVAFLDMFVLIPGTIENNPLLTVALILLFGICVYLAMREEGKRK